MSFGLFDDIDEDIQILNKPAWAVGSCVFCLGVFHFERDKNN